MEWPRFHMPWWEATGRRLRRSYQWIYAILLGSWLVVLASHPTSITLLDQIAPRATLGPIPGGLVIAGMGLFYAALVVLGMYSFWASRIRHKSLPAGHPGRMGVPHHEET